MSKDLCCKYLFETIYENMFLPCKGWLLLLSGNHICAEVWCHHKKCLSIADAFQSNSKASEIKDRLDRAMQTCLQLNFWEFALCSKPFNPHFNPHQWYQSGATSPISKEIKIKEIGQWLVGAQACSCLKYLLSFTNFINQSYFQVLQYFSCSCLKYLLSFPTFYQSISPPSSTVSCLVLCSERDSLHYDG